MFKTKIFLKTKRKKGNSENTSISNTLLCVTASNTHSLLPRSITSRHNLLAEVTYTLWLRI